MPNPILITGGPGSGKTDTVVERLGVIYRADPFANAVVLVPTLRHGDQFRRRLVSRCGVALGLRVETIGQFSHGLVSSTAVSSHALVDELLTRTIRSQVEEGSAAYFRPIAGTRGLSALVRGAVGDLLAEGVDSQALSKASEMTGNDRLMALSAIYAAFVAELEQRGWVHPTQIALSASKAVAAGASTPDTCVLDGFHLFRGTELALLQTLAQHADTVITLDPNASSRSRYDYERLLDIFPDGELVELSRNGASAHTGVLAKEAPARVGQLRLFPEAENGDIGTGRPTSHLPPAIIAGEVTDREGQLRAIARQIKQRLTDQPHLRPSDFAVAFRQASPHLRLARQIFAEYNLPLDPAAGERLNSRPLGVWIRRLMHLADDGWKMRDIVAVLSSGFVGLEQWGLYSSDVAQFARYARDNHLWSGYGTLGRVAEGLRIESEKDEGTARQREAKRRASIGMAAALEALRTLLERPVATVAEHARSIEDALFGDNGLIRASTRENPGVGVEMDALRGYLQELVSTHEALGGEPEEFGTFRARIEAKADIPAVLLREAGGVLLAPMHTLHGLRFDFVAVGGLIAGEFPAPRTRTGLLNNSAIGVLNQAGMNLPPEARLTEDELWASVSTRADNTMCMWKTRLDERGRAASPSHYFPSEAPEQIYESRLTAPERTSSRRELAIACTQAWTSGSRLKPLGESSWPVVHIAARAEAHRRSFNHAGPREGVLPHGLAPWLTGSNAVWSASRIESYRTCAFQFFGQYGLRLQELDQELDGADAATRGTVIHDILQDALDPLIESGEPLTPNTLDTVAHRLHAHGRDIWNSAPAKHGFGRAALWRLEYDDTARQLVKLLRREAERSEELGVTRILGAERAVTAELPLAPPLKVFGRIDRIDVGDDFVVIVDYKSGRPISETDVLEGRRVQLQLYGYLGREEVNARRVIARYAWVKPGNRQWELDSEEPEGNAALEQVLTIAQDVRQAVDSGDFRVNPQVPCPRYCSMRHVCRVNQFSPWKWRES